MALEPSEPRASRAVAHPVVRAVGRIPAKVRTKLLVAFVGTVVMFVIVGLLGIRVLGDSNSRVERLGALQQRAAAYRELSTEAAQVRLLLGLRAGGSDQTVYVGGKVSSAPTGRSLVPVDQTIASTLAQIVPATEVDRLGFVPSAADDALLRRIRSDAHAQSQVMTKIIAFDQANDATSGLRLQHAQAEPAASDLLSLTGRLVDRTQSQSDALIAQNRSSFSDSRDLFIGVAAGGIALALALGLVLSWSVIGPIQRMETRVAAITAGDFSDHVDVSNRDELGMLATNVNRMNDQLRNLYQELETASRHKSEFLANMSHELRTPLNAIIGFSEVLHEQMFGTLNEQQLGYVDDVLESGRHLLALINDVLDLSKVEAGRMELEVSDFLLADALRSGLALQGERATRAGVALDLSVEPSDIVIRADERKVRQIVFNLLSNAVKFTPGGGHVDVSARVADGVVEVAVADTGPGIAPEDQELIFEEFQQAPLVSGGHVEGTGLGLPLSR
jgi:signal transduction histidine kinase